MPELFRFGPFEIDLAEIALRRDGARLAVQPKVIDALALLLRAAGETVSRADLTDAIWADVHVTDASLRQLIRRMRLALGEHGEWIEVVPTRGYRFAGPVERLVTGSDPLSELRGREDATKALDEALANHRLVTLHGPGGIGKTALAASYLRSRAGRYSGGAVWVDLVPARDRNLMLLAFARALDVHLGAGDSIATLGRAVAKRGPLLLGADNAEHLLEHAPLFSQILDLAPRAQILVTSRARLGEPTERLIALQPLRPHAALALLSERTGRDLAGDPNASAIIEAIGGNPLGLLLAARRLKLLSPADLARRLRDDLAVIDDRDPEAGGEPGLAAVAAGSWALASPEDRETLGIVSVFAGPFTLDDAERIAPRPIPLVERLQRLVEHAWLSASDGRFAVTQALRAFLRPHRDLAAQARWEGALIGEARRLQRAAQRGERAAVDRLYARIDDLSEISRAGDGERAAIVALALEGPLQQRGPLSMIEELCDRAVSAGISDPDQLADVLRARADVARRTDRLTEAIADYDRALALAVSLSVRARVCRYRATAAARLGRREEAHRDALLAVQTSGADEIGRALMVRANIAHDLGDPCAKDLWQEALERCPRDDFHSRISILVSSGCILQDQGRLTEAESRYLECYDVAVATDHRRAVCAVSTNLGNVALQSGRIEEARSWHRISLEAAQRLGDARVERICLGNLAACAVAGGAPEEAESLSAELLTAALHAKDEPHEAWARIHLAALAWERGRIGEACARLDAVQRTTAAAAFRHRDHASALACALLAERDQPDAAMAALPACIEAVDQRPDIATRAILSLVPAFAQLARERAGASVPSPDPVSAALSPHSEAARCVPHVVRCLARSAARSRMITA